MNPSTAYGRPEYLRVRDIVRPHGMFPISRSTFYNWLQTGKAPPGTRLSSGVVVWERAALIVALTHAVG
jgi:predicted DNA-binding transcriptional regulator AlpA